MTEELFKLLNAEQDVTKKVNNAAWENNGEILLSNAQILDLALPLITEMFAEGMTLQDVAQAVDTFWEEPWRDLDPGE